MEHAEAEEQLVFDDLIGAIEFVGHLTMLIRDGGYDDAFEDLVQCLVTSETETDRQGKVTPVKGFKQSKGRM